MLRLSSDSRDRIRAYARALLTAATAAAIAARFEVLTDPRFTFLPFFPAVSIAAWGGGFWPGALATTISALAADYLFLPPVGGLRMERWLDAFALALFVASALLVSVLAERRHRRERKERDGRLHLELQAHQSQRLQELTAALARAQSPSDVIDACVQEVAHGVGAPAALLALVAEDGESMEIARSVGFPPEIGVPGQAVSLADRTPIADAIHSQEPVIVGSSRVRSTQYPQIGGGHVLALYEAVAAFPLVKNRRAIAVLTVAFTAPRTFSDDELRFLVVAAERTAQVLERARRQESAERAREDAETQRARADQELIERQKMEEALRESEAKYRALAARTSRLHAMTGALSEAVTLDAVAKAVVRQGKIVVGANGGSVVLLADEGRQFETLYAEEHAEQAVEAWHRFSLGPGFYSTAAVETRKPVFVRSFSDWQKRFWRSAPMAADCGYASAAALPLVVEGAPIGVLSFHFTAPVNFDEEYVALLTSVAQHAAQAIDRARLYETTERARDEAEAASRLKDDFLSTVSHELRAPLHAILGWSSMLRSGSLDASRTSRALDAIFTNASRQAALIDDLLDVARIVGGRAVLDLHRVDLADLLRGAVEAVMPLAEAKGVELHCDAAIRVEIAADARRLEQVFLNLLSNGVKFTPKGGRVDVQVIPGQESVEIRVTDTGIGIDPEFFPHIFERFRQADSGTSRRFGGLGLGLSIAHNLVRLHGGTIRAESPGQGQGSTFIVSLPITQDEAARPALPPSPPSSTLPEPMTDNGTPPHLDGVRVLVVDDESDAREMITSALERCGATVVPASSTHDALEALGKVEVDVMLADIAMPGEDGYALIRKVRSLNPGRMIPAAAVTACVREDERQQALDAGFQMHVHKPVDPTSLAERVAELLRTPV
jgi:K+-sensing histidine kinase KdpD